MRLDDKGFKGHDVNTLSEMYYDKFKKQMRQFETNSPLSKMVSLTPFHYYALGEQLQQFENYRDWFLENGGTTADLGKLPDIALDVITASYSSSIVPLISSVQPIEEEQQSVYFKKVKAKKTKGNVTTNQVLNQPYQNPDVFIDSYASEMIEGETAFATDTTLRTYNGTLSKFPVRPNTIYVQTAFTGGVMKGQDMGDKNIAGVGFQGTIDYATGNYSITFVENPPEVKEVKISYGVDYEAGAEIPDIGDELDNIMIKARVYALRSEFGMLKAYNLQKRFGMAAQDEMIQDLTNNITLEIGNHVLRELILSAPTNSEYAGTNATWNKTATNVAWADHKEELLDSITRRSSQIITQAGRGDVNYLIGGPEACGYLSTMRGFISQPVTVAGPAVFGTLNGMTIIRAPQLQTNRIWCIYKGNGYFDTPIIYAPYMPLTIRQMQTHNNYMKETGFVAVMAGIKTVAKQFICSLDIV